MTAIPIEASCRVSNGWPIPRGRCGCRAWQAISCRACGALLAALACALVRARHRPRVALAPLSGLVTADNVRAVLKTVRGSPGRR